MQYTVSQRKLIRDMNIQQILDYCRATWKEIKAENAKGNSPAELLTLFAEAKSQYRQITGKRMQMKDII